MTLAYLLFGVINAFFAGFAGLIAVESGWNLISSGLVLAFVASAILLMRAPFSDRNIDHPVILGIKIPVLIFLIYLEYLIVVEMIKDTSDAKLILVASIIAVTIYLLALMTTMRKVIRSRFRSVD